MSKIRILPEQLANRIAAGEVVERPASVVKELIENSLDAGATRIEVEIEGGGTRLIRVIDNGEGMDEDDIILCFERHGTSKIDEAHDLVAINTLGFRGEAIPSIASVAKMSVTSRPKDAPLGTTVEFDFGRLMKVHETGCSQGTVIEVRNLFGRTPARKKFLRTVRTELGHIDEILKNSALAYPDKSFIMRVNGKETLMFNLSHTLAQRLSQIMNFSAKFVPVGRHFPSSETKQVQGYLVPPDQTLSGSARLRLFINGRAIRNRVMSHAVFEGLRGFLLKNHSPAGYIHLHLPAAEVDVNVHPAKHEVRFRNSADVHQCIKVAVEKAMHDYQNTLRACIFGHSNRSIDSGETDKRLPPPTPPDHAHAFLPFSQSRGKPSGSDMPAGVRLQSQDGEQQPQPYTILPPRTFEPTPPSFSQEAQAENEEPECQRVSSVSHGLQIIGQFKNLYIFCRSGDGLVVIDQHAAHERLLYEKLRQQYRDGRIVSQTLMFPENVELSPFQLELVETHKIEIAQMGFSISEFGGNSYIISAIPAIAGQSRPAELFLDFLHSFGQEDKKGTNSNSIDNVLANMACKAAVKSGDNLSPEEIASLLDRMAEAELFSHCPHGRPVFKNFSMAEIKKWFHRT